MRQARINCYGGVEGAAKIGVNRPKITIEADQSIVDDLPDLAQRVPGRNAIFKIDVAVPHNLKKGWPSSKSCRFRMITSLE